jgi:hypothetical protein
LRWSVPEETFEDREDGNTRRLRLSLRHENGSLIASGSHSWIAFDADRQQIRLL